MTPNFFKDKKVFITGHTGFKGSWLCAWLKLSGAEICGFSNNPPSCPYMFELISISQGINSEHGDIRDFNTLKKVMQEFRPEIIIHMAAQSLVRRSYHDPIETYSSNVMGTVNILEAARQIGGIKAIIIVTSDKCYENKEWIWGYRENDPMGGHDPYSSSKGCAELVTSAYSRSFFSTDTFNDHGVAVSSARAGNVIGGGDFAQDRLVPDMVRAFVEGKTVHIRYPKAVRPWQHVLDPLSGYLSLAKNMYENGPFFSGSWNFGPSSSGTKDVEWVVKAFSKLWGNDTIWIKERNIHPHEASFLALDCTKARIRLNWKPLLNVDKAVEWTAKWYSLYYTAPSKLRKFTLKQIRDYEKLQKEANAL